MTTHVQWRNIVWAIMYALPGVALIVLGMAGTPGSLIPWIIGLGVALLASSIGMGFGKKWAKALYIAAVGLPAIALVAYAFFASLTFRDRATSALDQTRESTSSTKSEADWAVTFEYAFPPNFWSVGQHQYTFLFESCPTAGELPGSLTNTFRVTEDAPRLNGVVYLHPTGLSAESVYGPFLEKIHPSQRTAAALSNVHLTQAEAEQAARDCKLFVTWENGPTYRLMPGEPHQSDR